MPKRFPVTPRQTTKEDYEELVYRDPWRLQVTWHRLFSSKNPFTFLLSWIMFPSFDWLMTPNKSWLRIGVDPWKRPIGLSEGLFKTHFGLFAGSGKGKGILGTILWLLTSFRDTSLVVPDPKNELVGLVCVLRKLATHTCRIIQPGLMTVSGKRYSENLNPLDMVLDEQGRLDWDRADVMVKTIVKGWFREKSVSEVRYDPAQLMHVLMIGLITYVSRHINPGTGLIYRPPFAAAPFTGAPPLAGLYDFFARTETEILTEVGSCRYPYIARVSSHLRELSRANMLDKLFSVIRAGLEWTVDPKMVEFASYSSCSIYSLANRLEAWFVGFRAEDLRTEILGQLPPLFYRMLAYNLEKLSRAQPGAKRANELLKSVTLLLEESGLYEVPDLPDIIVECRSKRLYIGIVAQGTDQFVKRYGPGGASTIVENLGFTLVIAGVGKIAQQLALKIGQQLYVLQRHIDEVSVEVGGLIPSLEAGYGTVDVPTLADQMPAAFMRTLPKGLGILIPSDGPPLFVRILAYFEWCTSVWVPIGTPKRFPHPGSKGLDLREFHPYEDVVEALEYQRRGLTYPGDPDINYTGLEDVSLKAINKAWQEGEPNMDAIRKDTANVEVKPLGFGGRLGLVLGFVALAVAILIVLLLYIH